MSTAVGRIQKLYTMANDLTTTLRADGRQHMDGALETVERFSSLTNGYLNRFVIIISAAIADRHLFSFLPGITGITGITVVLGASFAICFTLECWSRMV